jgi:hypothetical protein
LGRIVLAMASMQVLAVFLDGWQILFTQPFSAFGGAAQGLACGVQLEQWSGVENSFRNSQGPAGGRLAAAFRRILALSRRRLP